MSMANPTCLRWGLLGTARINQAVISPIRSSKKSLLLAVASRLQDKAAQYAESWKIPHYYASYEALLADPEIDVIYNSLPNGLHAEWSIKAMQMGKHVLCEKPITTNIKEIDAVIETSKKTGMVIAEAFMYRHHPQTLFVKEIIDNGQVGNLQLIRGSFCYTITRPDNPRLDPHLGGGSLWDVGCYPISYARYVIGEEPIAVYGSQVTGLNGIDMLYSGQLSFPGGVISQFECSFITPFKALMEITGDRGRITIPEPYKPGKRTKILYERDGVTRIIWIKGAELYRGEIEDLEDAILLRKPTRISLDESKGNIVTIEALYRSTRLLKSISLK